MKKKKDEDVTALLFFLPKHFLNIIYALFYIFSLLSNSYDVS